MKQPVYIVTLKTHNQEVSIERFNLRTEAMDTYWRLIHHHNTEECYMEHRNRDGLTVEQWKYWR